MATAAPPLGPQLGQRGLNVANFCKDFNKATAHIIPGTCDNMLVNPIRCLLQVLRCRRELSSSPTARTTSKSARPRRSGC